MLSELLKTLPGKLEISAFVRSAASRDAVRATGATPVHFEGLGDLETIKKVASENDSESAVAPVLSWNVSNRAGIQVVISAASSMDTPSSIALVEGLGLRKNNTGNEVYYIHVSTRGLPILKPN